MKIRHYSTLLKLLGQNVSILQLAGYALAALTGISIILAGYSFSKDIRPLFSSDTNLFRKELITVNKKVSVLAAFGAGNSFFTQQEMDEIKQQSFVRSLSWFTPSRFQVRAYMAEGQKTGAGLSTDMFFESVPDRLLDKQNPNWKWVEESHAIPIIIPQDYLNLYNFGFAGSQGLPQISEGIIQQLVFKVLLSGNGKQEIFDGQIVDFSDELNTILVPESFMDWANERFASGKASGKASRLIVEVKNPADPAITEFFAANPNYTLNDNKGETGKLSYFLGLLIVAVMIIGGLIMLPSIGLMLLCINLLVYKSQKMLGDLMLLGYRRIDLSLPYYLLVLLLNLLVGFIALVIVHYLRSLYIPKLAILDVNHLSSNFGSTIIFALIFMAFISWFDIFWIKQKIKGIDLAA
jgi:hypothetical protein